ncbi:hypothetical protein FGSG_04690 [Fusarium graminearum PH-1]|uniref:hypothetical protein n=1 Tax=Gibberella zeae (strain ATCC MYA-4620 / CBS 123657 / FGSC 9075 / NRRL 31084 / PH-1) TaxID=229533 RepID=UPI000023EF9A|nr:hypothetical protein FGSG_04690 [Fusarium graminearum PH-1]ESU08376.1 hypothetical protein FGSG_04690 [Fusarium graminearum PH-1]|eukprot:XP_011320875.1 hypothetical protein FGSG_04690 [Fusarium graminearum PH-1]
MAAGFALLAAVCLLLYFSTSRELGIHAFCGSIAGHAAILANSPILNNLLRTSGHLNDKGLASVVDKVQFKVTTKDSGDVSIDISEDDSLLGTATPKNTLKATSRRYYFGKQSRLEICHRDQNENDKAWVPITGSFAFVIVTIAFPILAICALELLYQLSNQRQGLIDMHKNDSTSLSYVIRMASTAVAFAIATMFNSLDFTIATLAPYSSTLRSGNVQANRSILFHLLSVSSFLVIIKTLRAGYLGAATSNKSTILGSFLTIVVSGLWILNGNVILEKPSSVMVTNWHNSWPIRTNDNGGASMALNLVRHGRSNTSLGIWEDVVLPDIEFSDPHTLASDTITQFSNYTYKVGALRPFLSCISVPCKNYTIDGGSGNVSVQFFPPYNCDDVDVNEVVKIPYGFVLTADYVEGWFGKYVDLDTHAGRSDADYPSIGIVLGQVGDIFGRVNDTEISRWNLKALAYSQGIEEVPIDVKYKGNPALRQINEKMPPKLERDKAWRWTNKTSKSQTFGYRLLSLFENHQESFPNERATHFDMCCHRSNSHSYTQERIQGRNRLFHIHLSLPASSNTSYWSPFTCTCRDQTYCWSWLYTSRLANHFYPSRALSLRIPILPAIKAEISLFWSLWATIALALMWPHGFAAPLASSSLSWNPDTILRNDNQTASIERIGDLTQWAAILHPDMRATTVINAAALTANDPKYAFKPDTIPLRRYFNPNEKIPTNSSINLRVPYLATSIRWINATDNERSQHAGNADYSDVSHPLQSRAIGATSIIMDEKWNPRSQIPKQSSILKTTKLVAVRLSMVPSEEELKKGRLPSDKDECPTVTAEFGKLPPVVQKKVPVMYGKGQIRTYDCYILAEVEMTAGIYEGQDCGVVSSDSTSQSYANCSVKRDDEAIKEDWLHSLSLDFTSEVLKYTVWQNFAQPWITPDLNTASEDAVSLSVDKQKIYIWLSMNATLTLAALIVYVASMKANTKTVRDTTLAPLTIDLSDILHKPETSGLCTAVSLNDKDHKLPRLRWQRDVRGSEDDTDQAATFCCRKIVFAEDSESVRPPNTDENSQS